MEILLDVEKKNMSEFKTYNYNQEYYIRQGLQLRIPKHHSTTVEIHLRYIKSSHKSFFASNLFGQHRI